MSTAAEALELVKSVEPTIQQLMDDHRERRDHWYFQDLVPWEQGRNFVDQPWQPSDLSLQPEVSDALVVNLLTEDNLPYYYSLFQPWFDEDSPLTAWSRLWTAEEGQHAIAMRSYLMVTRNCDPQLLEDQRMATVETGWFGDFNTIVDMFCYTSAQELATRISHRNAGVKSDCEHAHAIMTKVARDENHHFIFYRGVTTELLAQNPDLVLPALARVLNDFAMPGIGIPGFARRATRMAKLGIYNLRIHAENVVEPLLRHWKIDQITGLSPVGAQAQAELMAMVPDLIERAEHFERRMERASRRKVPAAVA
ncbi:MAG: acyl-ACP desaturase [Actinomycetota bacterium]